MILIWTIALVVGGVIYIGFVWTALQGILKLRKIAKQRHPANSSPIRLPSVSVVLAARNEEAEIGLTLESLLAQSYPKFEIIVIDDRSTDATARIVREFAGREPRVRMLNQTDVPIGWSPKKSALMMGIEAATGEIIAATDADCRHHPDWLKSLVAAVPASGGMCIGQARFDIGSKPPLWQRVQALDFTAQEILSVGLVAAGSPYNCSGASIAYRRSSFDMVNGWAGVENFISGDDELLMAKFAAAGIPIIAASDAASVVYTRPPSTLLDVWRQRVRWGSKTMHYPWRRKLTLSGVFLFYLALAMTPVMLIVGTPLMAALIAFTAKLIVDGALLTIGGSLFGDRLRPVDFLIAELLHPPVIVAMAVAGAFGQVQWKDDRFDGGLLRHSREGENRE